MSARRSLVCAVRDQLLDTSANGGLGSGHRLNLQASECEVMFDGRPKPNCGKRFVSISQMRRSNSLLTGDESEFGVMVTVSYRTNAPFDRLGTAEVDAMDGLDDLADAIWACVFKRQWGVSPTGIMNKANNYLTSFDANAYPWTEALYPTSMGEPVPQREEWFNASRAPHQSRGASYSETLPFCGVSVAIQFGGAKRLQRLDDVGG